MPEAKHGHKYDKGDERMREKLQTIGVKYDEVLKRFMGKEDFLSEDAAEIPR